MLAPKGKPPRSAILDGILARGETLASDYALHYPVATPSEPVATPEPELATPDEASATPSDQPASKHGKHPPGYWKAYRERKARGE
jgi:hypothetical protein